MYQFTIANQIIPNLWISVDVDQDSASLASLKLKLAPPKIPYNAEACVAFTNYLESNYDVSHKIQADGSQEFILNPTATSWHSSPSDYARFFVQHMSAYYGVPAAIILEQCTNAALAKDPIMARMHTELKDKLTITDKPDTKCIEIAIRACDAQTEFSSWLERIYQATRSEKDGIVTLALHNLKGTDDRLDNPTHLVQLMRGMIDAWGFTRPGLVEAIQPPTIRPFANAMLHMRPHPLLEQDLRNQLYGNQTVVIGAGFTGVSIVYQTLQKLIKNPPSMPIHLTMVERNPEHFAGGLAYGAASSEHRVNVQAQYLSVDPNNPNDFVEWLGKARHDRHQGDARFLDIPESLIVPSKDPAHAAVQRQLYHHYLLDRLYETVTEARAQGVADVEVIFAEAISASIKPNDVSIQLSNGETAKGNNLILANGHGPVSVPSFLTMAYHDAPERVVADQWGQRDTVEGLFKNPDVKHVVVLGTGLSAMDIMMTAHKQGFFDDPSRKLTLMSRGGHTHPILSTEEDYIEPKVKFEAYEKDIPHKIEDIPAFVQRVFTETRDSGITAIGRPYSNEETFFALVEHIPPFILKSQIPIGELLNLHKKYSSLITTTAVAMAPEIGNVFTKYKGNGQVEILSVDTKSIAWENNFVVVTTDKSTISTDAIISALPPQSDPKLIPIINDLVTQGVIRYEPDTHVGLDVTDHYKAINKDGHINENVFVSGPIISGHAMEKLGLIGPLAQIITGLRPGAAEISKQLSDTCYENGHLRVGIVTNLDGHYDRTLSQRWLDVLYDFGMQPYLIDPNKVSPQQLDRIMDNLDGILLPGGNTNIHPKNYGEEPLPGQTFDPERTAIALALIQEARKRDMPLLGICLGAEELNVAYGGKIDQKLCCGHDFGYTHPDRVAEIAHDIVITPSGRFSRMYGVGKTFGVTSVHRQGIKTGSLSPSLKIEAVATGLMDDDKKVIEAFADPMKRFMIGVQYHPEFTPLDPNNRRLFTSFTAAVRDYHINSKFEPAFILSKRVPMAVTNDKPHL